MEHCVLQYSRVCPKKLIYSSYTVRQCSLAHSGTFTPTSKKFIVLVVLLRRVDHLCPVFLI